MTRILAALALVAGGLGLAACHTTDPITACRDNVIGNIVYDNYTLVDADPWSGHPGWANCLIRNRTTFQQIRVCTRYSDHQIVRCD